MLENQFAKTSNAGFFLRGDGIPVLKFSKRPRVTVSTVFPLGLENRPLFDVGVEFFCLRNSGLQLVHAWTNLFRFRFAMETMSIETA